MQTKRHPQMRTYAILTGVVCALAVVFNLFFSFEKHTLSLVAVTPFTIDPYDAVGSFGIQAAVIFGLLAALRTFQLARSDAPTQTQQVILIRTQMAATLAVALTLAADAVALARHPSVWIGSAAGAVLGLLVGALFVVACLVAVAVQRSNRTVTLPTITGRWPRAVILCGAAIALLALYPEGIANSRGMGGALLTAFAGAVALIVPLWALLTALSPYRLTDNRQTVWMWMRRYGSWALLVALAGVVVGLLVYANEGLVEGLPMSSAKIIQVALVFMGLEGSGILLGYLFLCAPLELTPPLGIFRRSTPSSV